ncbi:ribonuclease H-like domain-containing protein [Phyllosticta citribraziliensis]
MFLLCQECERFFLQSPAERYFSHEVPVVFTDGACLSNGNEGAKAGWGVAIGTHRSDQFDSSFSGNERRTNQRAELLGVNGGMHWGIYKIRAETPTDQCWVDAQFNALVIATDSEYAVKGLTEWLPEWKENNFRTSTGRRPQNESIFRNLDNELTRKEG